MDEAWTRTMRDHCAGTIVNDKARLYRTLFLILATRDEPISGAELTRAALAMGCEPLTPREHPYLFIEEIAAGLGWGLDLRVGGNGPTDAIWHPPGSGSTITIRRGAIGDDGDPPVM